MRTLSASSATSIRRRRLVKLNATIGWRSSGAEAMYPCRASKVTVPRTEAVHRMPCSLWGRICPDSD